MKNEKNTPVSTSDLLPGSLRSPDSQTVPEVERVRRYPDRRAQNTGKCYWSADLLECKWETDCERAFCFIEDGPVENEYRYCPGCGGRITLKGSESDDEGGASPGNAREHLPR